MKKVLLLLTVLTAATAAQARSLSPDEALARLQSDATAAKAPAVRAMATGQPKLIRTTTTEAGMPAVYLFENAADNRMLFVAADDVATPLLGYSDLPVAKGTAMPPQLEWWLSEYAREIACAQLNGATSADAQNAPGTVVAYAAGTRQPIEPMITTKWDQGEPYNDDCPTVGTQKTYTGCVATSMAQIMNYFKWPAKGSGIGQAKCNKQTLSLDLSTITFDWDNMRDTYFEEDNATAAQRKAVSQLMIACGYSVNMDYGTNASGAISAYISGALIDNFNYDAGVSYVERSLYSLQAWEDLIYNNIANVGPVCYSGRSTDGGHSFICDGYSSDGFFHFNWGWSGSYNGYYTLQALNPDGQGIGGFAGGYNFMQGATIGIQRPTGISPTALPELTTEEGISAELLNNGSLTINGGFYNYNSSAIYIDIYATFVPENGGQTVRYKIVSNNNLQANYGFQYLKFYPSQVYQLSNGTYKVYLETTAAGKTDKYYPLIHPFNKPNYFLLTKGSTYTVNNLSAANADIRFTELFSEIYIASTLNRIAVNPRVSYTIQNNSDLETSGGLAFQIVSGTTVIAYSTGTFYDLMPGESSTENLQLQLSLLGKYTLGASYDLYVYDPNVIPYPDDISASQKIATVTFIEYPGATMIGSGLKITGNAQAVDPSAVSFTGNLSCTKGVFGGPLYADISTGDMTEGVWYGSIAAVNLKAQESTPYSGTVNPETPLNPDSDYVLTIEYSYILNGRYRWVTLEQIPFHTAALTGIDNLTANSTEAIGIAADGAARTATVTSPYAISNVMVVSISGAEAYAPVSYQSTTAVVAMDALPAGIYVIRATDAGGNSATTKVALQ